MSHRASGICGFSVILLEGKVGLNVPPDSVTFPTLPEVANPGAILFKQYFEFVISQWFTASVLSAALHHAVRC